MHRGETYADIGLRLSGPRARAVLVHLYTASGALLAFALSFDEIIVTNFTAGPGTETVPLFIYSAIQRPAELPVVNVVALVLILLSIIPVWLATRLSSDRGAMGRG